MEIRNRFFIFAGRNCIIAEKDVIKPRIKKLFERSNRMKPKINSPPFAIERLKQLADADPKLLNQPDFKAAVTSNIACFARLDPHACGDIKDLMRVLFDSHAGMSLNDFLQMANDFLETAKHPVLACCTRI